VSVKINLLYVGLISALVLIGAGLGVYFGVFHEKPDSTIVLTIQGSSSTKNYTMTDIRTFDSKTGSAGYRKSTGTLVGPNNYTGVELAVLLDDAGGLNPGEELEIIASDDYKVVFTYEMLQGRFPAYDSLTGDYLGIGNFSVILAYEMDGGNLAPGDGKLRIACLAADGENYLSDGSPWVKDVANLNVIPLSSWIVYLYGITNDSVNKNTFEAFMYLNNGENRLVYQVQEGDRLNTYEGLALWRLIAIIDGGSTDTFNDTLAAIGYNVTLKNSLAETVVLDIADVARDDSYILAAEKNSVFLGGSEAPLKLVGSSVPSLDMLGGIIEIWLDF
jgi:hypothetical protein